MPKYIYAFGGGTAEGEGSQKDLLGGKGAGLAEMSRLGIPVPPGFTITTEVCKHYQDHRKSYPDGMEQELQEHLQRMEELLGQRFGDPSNPLLVSVRSGAARSMPGMMDTVLNLGLNGDIAEAWIAAGADERFVLDAYRRLLTMYGDVVLGLEREEFEKILTASREEQGVATDAELSPESLRKVVAGYLALVEGHGFPQDPMEQLRGAIRAVFDSWDNQRARDYRRLNKITGLLGTAVNVQAMVYGNRGADCATGVAFTRNPATGEPKVFGEYLVNAQGEHVVAGIRTPQPIHADGGGLSKDLPQACKELEEVSARLNELAAACGSRPPRPRPAR